MPDPFKSPSENKSLLDVLLSKHLITEEKYKEIKLSSATKGVLEESVLTSLSIVSDKDITEAKATAIGVPFIDLSSASFSPQALGFIPASVAERFSLISFAYDDKTRTLSVAMSNAVDMDAVSFIRQKTGLNIKIFAAEKKDVEKAISIEYRQGLIGEVGEALKETEESNKTRTYDSTRIAQIVIEAPIAKIVSTILDYAVASRASDIHIEPEVDRICLLYTSPSPRD